VAVQFGEEKALGTLHYGLPVQKGSCKNDGDQYLTLAVSGRTKGNGFKLKGGT